MAPRLQFQPTRHHRGSETAGQDHAVEVTAYRLERARTTDAAWRTRRAARYQAWIDRLRSWEQEGRRWVHSPGETLWHAIRGVLLVAVPLSIGNSDPRLGPFLGVLFGGLLLLRPVLGMCLHESARLGRRLWLRNARRANIEVVDPGDLPLFVSSGSEPPRPENPS